ncbi:gfo/Idh/MocA family oxidoreductase, partial [Streptomyces sp. Z38]|nr:gfo/Idh/MocA family oxidoreductase [Streptomyces sp. Z38]
MTRTPLPVVLAGARGHGRRHVDNIRRLAAKGLVRLAGICELTPLTEDEFGGELPEQSADLGALLDSTGARAAVICTPIPTHTALAPTAA